MCVVPFSLTLSVQTFLYTVLWDFKFFMRYVCSAEYYKCNLSITDT